MPPATSAAQPANLPPAAAAANLPREDKPAAPVRVASARTSDNSFLSGMFSEPRRPPGFGEANDPEPPLSATEERLERSRTSEDAPHANVVSAAAHPASPIATTAGAGPVIVTTAANGPASLDVNGVTKTLPRPAGPPGGRSTLVQPSRPYTHESIPGQAVGRYWKAAHPHVVTHCFDSTLRNALNVIGLHFRRTVLVTSGHRTRGRRRSMHRFCRAADIRVPGIRPSRVARFARGIPGINGIGTYRRKAIVHIDTRLQQMVWRY